jgi:hypothetical protein
MGMFDYVNFSMPCPECGTALNDWQSKSGECTMATVNPDGLGCFYESCPKCKAWIDFTRDTPPVPARPAPYTREEVEAMGFKMIVTKRDKPPAARSSE